MPHAMPGSPSEPARPPGGEPVASAGGRGGTVLFVEDDDMIRRAGMRLLLRLGYAVIGATDGWEALEILRRDAAGIRLVITDVNMPRLGGRELLQALDAEGMRVPVLFSTGYDAAAVAGLDRPGRPVAFLQKPWGLAQVTAAVTALLAEAGPAGG